MSWQNFFKSRATTWLLSAVLLLVMLISARMFIQKHAVDKEIAKLQAETDKIRRDNEQLSGLIKYLNTPEYQEKEAREKLNLKKDGEYVVVLPDSIGVDDSSQNQQSKTSNIKQWFNYFFKTE